MNKLPALILASSSPYRQELLAKLGLPFTAMSPDIDESAWPGEAPEQVARRLSLAKAKKIAALAAGASVIGSDQLAVLGTTPLAKPGTHANAFRQLVSMRGHSVDFHTGLCVLDGRSGEIQQALVSYAVRFRHYTDEEIERYLCAEQPYDCAGSFKSEALGVSLIEEMKGPDPSALIGLPLIRLCEMLRNLGYNLP